MPRKSDPTDVVEFAGLTRHNQTEISTKAQKAADGDHSRSRAVYPDDMPDTSFATAVRNLERATTSEVAWKVPEEVADQIDVGELNDNSPDDISAMETGKGEVFVTTDRYQTVFSPDKVRKWANGDYAPGDDNEGEFRDPLWHVPTNNYSIVNPLTAYEPLENAVREEELGDSMFGQIRSYKGGGEIHMDVMFDAYTIDYHDDDDGREPIVLGIRTGYDFFGDTALYFEGFAQDTRCSNSIRAVTERKSIRHVGDVDLEDEVESVLEELGLMQDRLAELIEMAEQIEVEMPELGLADPFDHDDDFRAFYELAGFPSYLAQHAAQHARQRADNMFLPDMTDLWDGATYAMTHQYRGGENTSRANELFDVSRDFIYNPMNVVNNVEQDHRQRMSQQSEGEQQNLDGESAHAAIEEFTESVAEKKEKFETRNEELRQMLVAETDGAEAETAE